MEIKLIISYFLGFVMCLAATFSMKDCSGTGNQLIESVHKETIKIYDSTKKVSQPIAPPVATKTQTIPIPVGLDSAQVVQLLTNFFAVHSFSQTGQDTNIRWFIYNNVSKNTLLDQRLEYQLLKPVRTINNTTITLQSSGLFIGGFISTANQNFGAGPEASWLTKKQVLFSYGYDIRNNIHKAGIQKHISWK